VRGASGGGRELRGDPRSGAPTAQAVMGRCTRGYLEGHPHERTMLSRCHIAAVLIVVAAPPCARTLAAQAKPHLIIAKMVDAPNAHFAFEPSAIAAQRGDTVRFVQASTAPHNSPLGRGPREQSLAQQRRVRTSSRLGRRMTS
jgi:plastocyanin